MLKFTLLIVGSLFLLIGALTSAGCMVGAMGLLHTPITPQVQPWDAELTFDDDEAASVDDTFPGSCCLLVFGAMFMLLGYEPARSPSWTPMICYLVCGLVLAPALCGVGWVLIHELRFQMRWETTRGAVSKRLFGDEREMSTRHH